MLFRDLSDRVLVPLVVNARLTYGEPWRLFDGCRVVDDGRRDDGPDGQGQLGIGR